MLKRALVNLVLVAICGAAVPALAADEAETAPPAETTPEFETLKNLQADAALAKTKLELATSELELLKLQMGTWVDLIEGSAIFQSSRRG